MTYQELVKKVQTALVKADASAITEHIAVQVNVIGEAEGAFYIEIKDGVLYVEPYDYWDRDFLLTGNAEEILSVIQGKVSLITAIADSRVFHEGNVDKAIAFGEIIPEKKFRKQKAETPETTEPAEKPADEKLPEEKPATTKRTKKTKTKADTEEKVSKPKRTKKTKSTKTEETIIPVEQLTLITETAPTVETEKIAETVETEKPKTAKRTKKTKEKTEISENPAPKKRGRKPKNTSK